MSIQKLFKCSAVIGFSVLVSGCSLLNIFDSDEPADSTARSSQCAWDRSSCMYEGRYEPGEEQYAEDEAKRLNRESIEKLRRGF